MNCPDLISQTLDGKYQMTRELGRGGMGAVYLATHLGTERPVAVKVIAPEFMLRGEFIERFRREARAAGRLRHPNVVDVTDFGFAETAQGQVAYLVMEYLDGCTLGEVLDEEKNLPVSWTLDILEQVCSAVHEAHEQGIIHRDLKPDNIWLEPNQRGGYTVKVLDFGIAKLEETDVSGDDDLDARLRSSLPTIASSGNVTLGGGEPEGTMSDAVSDTKIPAAATVAPSAEHGTRLFETDSRHGSMSSESETAIFNDGDVSGDFQDSVGTKIIFEAGDTDQKRTTGRSLYDSKNSADLTRVGAVLGTPLYMSPEQCRGEHLDARSDIYSLGVIAYQMLSGSPPFEGDFKDVMESHKSVEPQPLDAKQARRKLKQAIHAALEKDPEKRPQTAEAFSSLLRARSEGIFGLLRRSLVIYSEHLPKFLMLTGFFSLPIILLTLMMVTVSFLKVSGAVSETAAGIAAGFFGFILTITSAFCINLIVGTNAWIVTQYLSMPLRPIRLRPALKEARKKWKVIAGSGILAAVLPFVVAGVAALAGAVVFGLLGAISYPFTESFGPIAVSAIIGAALLGLLGFFTAYTFWLLVSPIVMLENRSAVEALRRSRRLVKRSFMTSAGAAFIILLIPAIIAGTISFVVNASGKAFDTTPEAEVESVQKESDATGESETSPAAQPEEKKPGIKFSLGKQPSVQLGPDEEMDMQTKVKHAVLESFIQLLWLPVQIIVFSFSAIIVALLYLKTRLAGGESMNDLIERFEDDERPVKKWQERVRQRLIQSGRIPSKP
ncbi:MAG: serine/threonine-protein kinase [Pyrinomonadaceae bacterium]